jgi:divalent metal cation (Fe/Co/Zn/Cd) transporter
MDTALTGKAARGVVAGGLATAAGLATVKLYLLPHAGTAALLASTVQSLIDASCLALLLYGIGAVSSAKRQAEETEQARADKHLYFWSFVVAVLLNALGAGIAIYEGIERLLHPRSPIATTDAVMALLAAGALVCGAIAWQALRRLESSRAAGLPVWELMRRPGNAPLLTVFLLSVCSVLGHVAALAGAAALHNDWDVRLDGAAAIGVGLVMAAASAALALEVRRVLVSDSVAERLRAGAEEEVVPLPLPVADAGPLEIKSMPEPPLRAEFKPADAPPKSPPGALAPKPPVHPRHQGKAGRGKRRR